MSSATSEPMPVGDIMKGFASLDAEIEASEILMSVAPLRIVTAGGSLAVLLCKNRETAREVDCLLDPNVNAAPDYANDFRVAIAASGRKAGLADEWLKQQVELYVAKERRMGLFLESVEQNIVLHEGPNLMVFAAKLEWALERKIRSVAHSVGRKPEEIADAAAIAHYIKERKEDKQVPLSFQFVRDLNHNRFEIPPEASAIRAVATFYAQKYEEVGLAELEKDDETGRVKYRGLDGAWQWVEEKEATGHETQGGGNQ